MKGAYMEFKKSFKATNHMDVNFILKSISLLPNNFFVF